MAGEIEFRPSSYHGDGLPRATRQYGVTMCAQVVNGPTLDYRRGEQLARFVVDQVTAGYDLLAPDTGDGLVWVCVSISLHGFHVRADGSYGGRIRSARGYRWYSRQPRGGESSFLEAPVECVHWAETHNPGLYAARPILEAIGA